MSELIQMLTPYNYVSQIAHLTNSDVCPQKAFSLCKLSSEYWLDTCNCYKQRRKNSQQLFELFGVFSEEDPAVVRRFIINHVKQEKELYRSVGSHHLRKLKLSIEQWIKLMSSDSVFGDELMVYALSCAYQWHALILTSKGYWTTIGSDDPIKLDRLLQICEVRLLFIGMHMFGELKRKPFVTPVQQQVLEPPCANIPYKSIDPYNAVAALDLTKKGHDTAKSANNEPDSNEYTSSDSDDMSEILLTGEPVSTCANASSV